MISQTIDINVDVGEGVGNESLLMPFVSSCNIACGAHAGDVNTMRDVVRLARKHKVKIGAHPSYPDKENFGRVKMDISCAALFKSVKSQIGQMMQVVREERAILHHVKPHGALYNLAAVDERVASVVVEAMRAMMLPVKLYVPYKSVIEELAKTHNIPIIYEAFADRNYNNDLSLVSRTNENASIHNENDLFDHVFHMISEKKVKTIEGHDIEILAQTFCIHGDNPNAINLIKNLGVRLKSHNIRIR